MRDGGADFKVVDRKGTTGNHKSKQQAMRGTCVNTDCRWASPGIAKLWVSLPKQGVAMATISRRTTIIIGEHELQGITSEKELEELIYNTIRDHMR